MGRTVPTSREVIEEELERWKDYREALRKGERESYDRMMEAAKKHASASGQAKVPDPFRAMIVSILLEQQKELDSMEETLETLLEKVEGE